MPLRSTLVTLAPAERDELLRIARAAFERRPVLKPASPDLARPAAAFVSLHTAGGDLRGCVGFTAPKYPLWEAVRDAAIGAATNDSRFTPVTAEEAPRLHVEISILGPLTRVAPDAVIVGTHGLFVRLGPQSGLLLPQVAVDWHWDRETFLDQVCLKASLPRESWKSPSAELFGFTAEVFGESSRP